MIDRTIVYILLLMISTTEILNLFLSLCCNLSVCKWLGVYLCMRESPATTPAVIDKYNVVIVSKGIHKFAKILFSACIRVVLFMVTVH